MTAKYTEQLQNTYIYSVQEAERLGNNYVGPEHLLLGLLRHGGGKAIDILNDANVNLSKIKANIESQIRTDLVPTGKAIPVLKSTEKIKVLTELESRSLSAETVDTEHLLLAILKEKNNKAAEVLGKENFDYNKAISFFEAKKPADSPVPRSGFNDDDDDDDDDNPRKKETVGATPSGASTSTSGNKKSDTPALDSFGTDITKAAIENRLDPVVGREKEIERLAQILSRRKKNNPVLIGDPGVGKSAIVEGLALRIIQRRVSRVLFDKRVVSLDMASIVAGTKYRGQFEERIKAIINELQKNKDIILFIDEIHTIIGAGGASGSLDAANILKPALARGEIQCIGATTLDEYRQSIEKDGALERRFQKIIVDPTTSEETLQILQNIQDRYELHHNVRYTPEAIKACVRLTDRYITDRCFPDKAIDALDEAGSRVHIGNVAVPAEIEELEKHLEALKTEKLEVIADQKYELAASLRDQEKQTQYSLDDAIKRWEKEAAQHPETVDEEKVAEVVAMMSGIPVQRIAQAEGLKLRQMKEQLQTKVIGQNEAVEKIVKAIQRNRIGLKDPNKPIGSFLFLGATGVGKTHLAKVLAEFMFDSSDALIRVDMSEYMEKFSVSRLIGAPPGYVGYEEGGQLTEKVRRKPYSIVLLDEIEKAHQDVFNLLLQVMDEGRLTDSLGRRIDFKNTIIIMTSNVGSRQLKEFGRGIGFNAHDNDVSDSEYSKGVIQKALNKTFSPEFLNRVDEVITFDQLNKEAIFKIIDLELKGLFGRVVSMGYTLELTPKAKDFIAEKGYDVQFGARPLKRAIQHYLEDELADIILSDKLKQGDTILMDLENDKIVAKQQ
ncbi:MAG: ATP-dependent Clp protease ATP-binding subunit [Prevotellaceae bacterium]|jgi:ATP-dependent Clp protease ATP-binding subunit ClpC|nr:ATP-dependent Clp protease ATP-binding subunit [Prevotellaceae bacterium]